ncbi:MAG: DUF167 domain-containing protein [Phycisphaerales bacterium]|nr:DUF167 domain-containing protein [Phycisphaerales bacterium]
MIHTTESGVEIRVKAVPGASRDAIGGPLGGRLKIRVAAPPEGGKANRAICALLARTLACRPSDVEVVAGQTHPEKTILVRGLDEATVRERLG